jgi:hypothetical protein
MERPIALLVCTECKGSVEAGDNELNIGDVSLLMERTSTGKQET